MATSAIRGRLQRFLHLVLPGSRAASEPANIRPSSRRRGRQAPLDARHKAESRWQGARKPNGLDIARFGLLSIATLPFSLWVSLYAWNYINRVHICQEALGKDDNEISHIRAKGKDEGPSVGRERQLDEVRTLLKKQPLQIIVVAGTNESGKTRFVSEILKSLPLSRGVTYIQLAQFVDSLSTFTHAFVRAFELRWLDMRHSLVDILPFAGSEILVMKERFSSRDLTQSLHVINEALKSHAVRNKNPNKLPVLVIDGLGETSGDSSWIRSPEGRRTLEKLIKWCIYITKERRLAHVVLTGNEELVISLTNQNRATRGHVKVISLDDLSIKEAGQLIVQDLPDATQEEIDKLTDTFGGFIHDIQAVTREIQARLARGSSDHVGEAWINREKIVEDVISARFRHQIERVTAAFAKGRDESDDSSNNDNEEADDDMDPYLDPLKAIYSEAQASQMDLAKQEEEERSSNSTSWTQLQLWHTLQRIVESESMTVPFADLRDNVFDGDTTPLLELMNEDVLGFEVESTGESGLSWEVKPATPAMGRVFQYLVNNSNLKERFYEIQQAEESRQKHEDIERERRVLRRERRRLELRKASLLKTVELGKELRIRRDKKVDQMLERIYNSMVAQEIASEQRGEELRKQQASSVLKGQQAPDGLVDTTEKEKHPMNIQDHMSIQRRLKSAVLEAHLQEGNKDKFTRFQHEFEVAASEGGITAEGLVRLIKATSGDDIDLKAAESFIRAWDVNRDTRLDYDEFIRMLLTDPKFAKRNTK